MAWLNYLQKIELVLRVLFGLVPLVDDGREEQVGHHGLTRCDCFT